MSERLTVYMRENIVRDLIQHRFSGQIDALIADQADFAKRVRADILGDDAKKIARLPKGWVPEESDIGVRFGDDQRLYTRLSFSGDTEIYGPLSQAAKNGSRTAVNARLPASMAHGCAHAYSASHPLSIEWEKLTYRRENLKEEIKKAKALATATLAKFSTPKRLATEWPEVAPFLPAAATAHAVPAIPVEVLNTTFDLPVEEAA